MASFTVQLENPPGVPILNNELIPGESLHISVQGGVLAAGSVYDITIEPINPPNAFATIEKSGAANLNGNWATDIIVPNVTATAHLRVTLSPSVGSDEVNIYLGIGTLPPPIPKPISWTTVLLWTGVAVGVGLVGWGVISIVRSRKPQQVTLVQPRPKLLTKVN